MSENDNPFKLTPEESKAYFNRTILPDLTAASKAVEQPVFILVGGQSGAGNSRLCNGVKK